MAITVGSHAARFSRTANLPSLTSFSAWGWFWFTSVATWQTPFVLEQNTVHSRGFILDDTGSLLLAVHGGGFTTAFSPSTDTWYFLAVTSTGNAAGNVIGYWRTLADNTLSSVSNSGSATNFTPDALVFGSSAWSEYLDGRMHAIGAADAVLSAEELLELSYFHEPQLDGIRSLNVFYPTIESVNTNASIDRSGNGRNATATVGALADSPPLLWRAPSPVYIMPAAAAAPASLLIPNTYLRHAIRAGL